MTSRVRQLLSRPYNAVIRPYLPRKIGVKNGVAVRFERLLDFDDVTTDWKDGTVSAVRQTVDEGDTVVEIGGGFGVCTVWAARRAGTDGDVITYEASEERYDILQETVEINKVADRVHLKHALVGENIDTFGDESRADEIPPQDLPECDTFITDCEGAELGILESIFDSSFTEPPKLVIETHGFAGASTDKITALLESEGYTIEDVQIASPHNSGEENDVVIAISNS